MSYDVFETSVGVEAPSTILDSLEDQITLFQTQGDGGNLTVIGDSVGVVAVQIPDTGLAQGLGFATLSVGDGGSPYDKLSENDTVVFFDTGEIPFDIIDAAIALPSTILDFIPLDVQSETILFFVFLLFRVSLIHNFVEYFYHLSSIL